MQYIYYIQCIDIEIRLFYVVIAYFHLELTSYLLFIVGILIGL